MEVIVVWLFTMFAVGSELEIANERTTVLQAEVSLMETKNHDQSMMIADQAQLIEDHENTLIKLATQHSALYARDQVEKDRIGKSIQFLTDELMKLKFSMSQQKTSKESIDSSTVD